MSGKKNIEINMFYAFYMVFFSLRLCVYCGFFISRMTFCISCNRLHWIVASVVFYLFTLLIARYVVAQLVEALFCKVAGSIPDCVIGIFNNHSGRTVALGLTQTLTEMSTRNISWRVKAADA